MVIAMAIVGVMKSSVNEVIDVIAMGHGFVSAARAVGVSAPGIGRTARGVGVADLNDVFVDMVLVRVVQMTIMEVVDMVTMAHGRVSAVRTMLMGVIGMMPLVAHGHGSTPYITVGLIGFKCLSRLGNDRRPTIGLHFSLPIGASAGSLTFEVR